MGKLIGLGVFVFFALTAVFGSFYTIDEGERGVITYNGKVTGTADPGLHFKTPLVEDVIPIDVRSQAKVYENVASYSRDQQPATMTVSVNYHIPPDQVQTVYSQYGSPEGVVTRLIDRRVFEQVKNVFGKYNAVSAIQDRSRLNADIAQAIQDSVHGPVVVEAVQIENIDFSDAYEASIEQRMLAEVEVQKVQQNAAKEKVTAEITVIKAQAAADAQIAEATAKAKATQMQGEAEASAIEARGKALRDNPAVIDLIRAEKWNGTLPTTMVPGSAVPFINIQ